MRFTIVMATAAVLATAPALAQTSATGTPPQPAASGAALSSTPVAPPSTPVAAPSVPAAAPTVPAMPAKAKEVRATCRTNVRAEGLRGEALRKAVSECVIRERPDLAAREHCRVDGYDKGLRKDELKGFIKDCAKNKG